VTTTGGRRTGQAAASDSGREDSCRHEAARHYDERGLAALILMIATTNVYNRLNVATRQVAGAWG
jgi:alkylhydroperoxidase family enzyme